MRRYGLVIGIATVVVLLGADYAAAQRVDDADLTVTARNRGGFECGMTSNFDFGSVDPTGTDYGTPNVLALGRNGGNTGSVYVNQVGSVQWGCRASPPGFVFIALNSTATDHTGGMLANDLEVRLRSRRIGIYTGYQLFASQALLALALPVGNGIFGVTGVADLRLTVRDVDPPGLNTWVVKLRATAFP